MLGGTESKQIRKSQYMSIFTATAIWTEKKTKEQLTSMMEERPALCENGQQTLLSHNNGLCISSLSSCGLPS